MTVFYECVKCGYKTSIDEWARGQPKLEAWEIRYLEKLRVSSSHGGNFKCPQCGFRVAKKTRPPIARRVNCV